jgi:hypothetical protein
MNTRKSGDPATNQQQGADVRKKAVGCLSGRDGDMTRRRILRAAGVTGLGTIVASAGGLTSASPAAASQGTMRYGDANDAQGDGTGLSSTSSLATFVVSNRGAGPALLALGSEFSAEGVVKIRSANIQPAVSAVAGDGSAVVGETFSTFFGVHGITHGAGSAVYGQNLSAASSAGVFGDSLGSTKGVWGRHTGTNGSGVGVYGETAAGTGVKGETFSTYFGVHGVTHGAGSAVYGQNMSAASSAGVFGDSVGTTKGVWGRHTGTHSGGIGVYGESAAGRGASFGGKLAQLRLRPSAARTHPATGQRGDFFVDSSGRLWFCKGSTTWKQLA